MIGKIELTIIIEEARKNLKIGEKVNLVELLIEKCQELIIDNDLSGIDFSYCSFRSGERMIPLCNRNLTGCDFSFANLDGIDMSGSKIDAETNFAGAKINMNKMIMVKASAPESNKHEKNIHENYNNNNLIGASWQR